MTEIGVDSVHHQSRKHKGRQYRQLRSGGKLNEAQDLRDLNSVGPAAMHDD